MTRLDAAILAKASRADLADSALQAPAADFGDDDFYPGLSDKAAVLACRIAWNHPLPDGNKRAAWACLVMFVDLNGGWTPDPPEVEASVAAMLAVAAREVDEEQFASWHPVRVQASAGECGSASRSSQVRGTRRRSPTLMHRSPSPVSRNRCASLSASPRLMPRNLAASSMLTKRVPLRCP